MYLLTTTYSIQDKYIPNVNLVLAEGDNKDYCVFDWIAHDMMGGWWRQHRACGVLGEESRPCAVLINRHRACVCERRGHRFCGVLLT